VSETVSWQFVGRRLDSVQADTADIRRRMVTLADRFGGLEGRMSGLEDRMSGIERRQGTLEERMDAMVERQSKLEATSARTLFLLQRLALKSGISDDGE
jgi:predicted  nucleic acid-binding Zn-ribbon protein